MRVRLLSDSCTKGWTSWGHGELWLTDDALVRVGKRDLTVRAMLGGAAAATGGVLGVAAALGLAALSKPAPHHDMDVDPGAWFGYVAAQKDVLIISYAQIASATLKEGLTTSSLTVRLQDGFSAKLLWKRSPAAVRALRQVLPG
ncbi:hypothetical protein ACFY36_14070 [Actinoplanes sp. NPDC000266]